MRAWHVELVEEGEVLEHLEDRVDEDVVVRCDVDKQTDKLVFHTAARGRAGR